MTRESRDAAAAVRRALAGTPDPEMPAAVWDRLADAIDAEVAARAAAQDKPDPVAPARAKLAGPAAPLPAPTRTRPGPGAVGRRGRGRDS